MAFLSHQSALVAGNKEVYREQLDLSRFFEMTIELLSNKACKKPTKCLIYVHNYVTKRLTEASVSNWFGIYF